jgi:ankyrin repeat protein
MKPKLIDLKPVDSSPNPVNDQLPIAEVISPEQAWALFFQEPFSEERLVPHFEILKQTLLDRVDTLPDSPLRTIAENAIGLRMAFATKVFAESAREKTRAHFVEGSLARMALAYGNHHGALDAAVADPETASSFRDSRGATLLIEAMLQGNLQLIHDLTVKRKGESLVDPFLLDSKNNTALINYIRLAPNIKVEVLDAYAAGLVKSKSLASDESMACEALYTQANSFGKTAAHILVDRLNPRNGLANEDEVLAAMEWLSNRININVPDLKDRTAFMEVCKLGNVRMAKEMERLGADIAWISSSGYSALSIAAYHNKPEIIHLLFDLSRENVLRSIDEMTEERIGHEQSIPYLTAKYGAWEALQAYLSHCALGIDTRSDKDDFQTALMYAVKANEDQVVKLLISKGASIHHVDADGMTALHYAARDFDNKPGAAFTIFNDLLNAGASLEIADNAGRSPLDIAMANGKFNSSDDFYYRVNVSKIAGWHFCSDYSLAESYVNKSPFASVACSGIINYQHPLSLNANGWLKAHEAQIEEAKKSDVKDGFTQILTGLLATGGTSLGLYQTVEKADFPQLTDYVHSIPTEWQLPAIALTSLATYLFTATKFGTDLSVLKKIGIASNHFVGRLDKLFIDPLRRKFKQASEDERAVIGKTLKLCSQMKEFCLKLKSACKAFVKVMERDTATPRSANQMLGQMDDKMIRDIAKMSRMELAKLHSEARHQARKQNDGLSH